MSALRQKMIDAKRMQLQGFAARTQEAYLLAVRQLAKHYHKSPDEIEEEELRQYFLFLKNEKQVARATCTLALCGIKFFFQRTLGREWKTFEFLRPPPAVSGLPDHDLCLRAASVGRGTPADQGYRWGTSTAAYPSGKRGKRPLRSITVRLLEDAASILAHPSQPALAVSVSVRRCQPTDE